MEDKDIIELYFKREEKAIKETQKRYGRYLKKISYNILGTKEDSEECVNDTYFHTWNNIPPKRPNCLKTFLAKITRNLSINRWEKMTAQKRGNGEIPLVLDELYECIEGDSNIKNIAESIVIEDALNSFLGGLQSDKRKIFVKRYFYIESIKDIAKEMAISESKVSVELFRMRKSLKKKLESEGISL